MNELALFAGAGGGLLASKILGWRTVAAVEWSEWNACVLAQRQIDGLLELFPIWDDVHTLTAAAGEALLTSYQGAFPAKPLVPQPGAEILRQKISGQKCSVLFAKSSQGLSSEKTSAPTQSTQRAINSSRWVTKPGQFPWPRRTWVRIMLGTDIGFLHTPTIKANYSAASMQKWPCARNFTQVFGRPSPENPEWLMGWPIGWSDIRPLETDKFQSWLSRLSLLCVPLEDREDDANWNAWRAFILS